MGAVVKRSAVAPEMFVHKGPARVFNSEEEASVTAKAFCALLGFDYKPGNSSIFAGSVVECCKKPFPGEHGHLAIGTNNVDRAMYHLGLQGIEFDLSTQKTDAKGTVAVYFKQQIGGFAIHLVRQ